MNPTEQAWLENRIAASVADDFYLDREEEKGIKEEAASKGFSVNDTELILRAVLDGYGAVSERQLIDTLDKWLHQSTDDDQKLDKKEERDTLDQVVRPATGKKRGLDPRVAEDYVANFCKANGINRSSSSNKLTVPLIIISALALIGAGGAFYFSKRPPNILSERQEIVHSAPGVKLNDADRAEIDDQLNRAINYVEASQLTDPPEKSAKACLDSIRKIDPNGTYRGEEIKGLVTRIVSQYIAMADRANTQKDVQSVRKWIDRAKLFHAESEVIRDKERSLGLIATSEQ